MSIIQTDVEQADVIIPIRTLDKPLVILDIRKSISIRSRNQMLKDV